jgi:hypothetical protein
MNQPQARWSVSLAAISVLSLGVAACGGKSSHGPGVASLGGTTTTAPSGLARALDYSQCMRTHGVTNFPDPRTAGPGAKDAVDSNSPAFHAAETACQQYREPERTTTPAQRAQLEADLLAFARCMRSHGVSNFPDPNPDPNSQGDFNFAGTGINQDSPTAPQRAAVSTCLPAAQGAVQLHAGQ